MTKVTPTSILARLGRSTALLLGLVLVLLGPFFAAAQGISDYELNHEIQARLFRVPEFKVLLQESKQMGVKVYLFGGTAAGFAHYVRWDLMREKGDARFQQDRFDYDFTNIYRSTQDLDIVVDGDVRKIEKLQQTLQNQFPYMQGDKKAWEVRSLRENHAHQMALLNNPDFLNQNSDSNSTGMIEITDQPGVVVHDLRDWNNPQSPFLEDVSRSQIHYYASDLHQTTTKFKAGENPLIFSAIRLLIKAVQFELEIRPEDVSQIRKIIEDFNPQSYPSNGYVNKWIEKNAKKLVLNAVNIEYATNLVSQLGLKAKLMRLNNSVETEKSLAWWMAKEPLRSKIVGEGKGRTARELGITVVAHETESFLAYESITKAHTGDPNVFISRNGFAGESALYGDGFYTKMGTEGAIGSGITIRFNVNPQAREGTDFLFVPAQKYVVFLNKTALSVIPESLNMTVLDYLKYLKKENIQTSDRGILEKAQRRALNHAHLTTPEDMKEIQAFLSKEIDLLKKGKGSETVLKAFMNLPIRDQFPEIDKQLADNIPYYKPKSEMLYLVFLRGRDFTGIPHVGKIFAKYYMDYLDGRGDFKFLFQKPGLVGNTEVLKELLKNQKTDLLRYYFSAIDDFSKFPGMDLQVLKYLKLVKQIMNWRSTYEGKRWDLQEGVALFADENMQKPGLVRNLAVLDALSEISHAAALSGFAHFEDYDEKAPQKLIVKSEEKPLGFFGRIASLFKPLPTSKDVEEAVFKLAEGFGGSQQFIEGVQTTAFPKISPQARTAILEDWKQQGYIKSTNQSCDSALGQ